MSALTPKQQQIYDFILSFSGRHGYPPSVREIGEHVGLKSPSTVHFHLKGLEAAGLITKDKGKTRAITVCPEQGEAVPAGAGAHCGQRGRRRPHPGPGVH